MLRNKQLMVPIDFHSMEKTVWKSMATVNCFITNILQKKKETHTGLEQLDSD